MLRIGYVFLIIVSVAFANSCTFKNAGSRVAGKRAEKTAEVTPEKFPYPEIPVMISDAGEKRVFLLKHYWDMFDFSDSLFVNSGSMVKEGFANYLSLLIEREVDVNLLMECMDNLCSGMEKYPYSRRMFMDLNDNYLYDPNSPYYNEKIYLIYLERMLKSGFLDEAEKSGLVFKRDLIRRNMPGNMATDFYYYMENGNKMSMSNTKVKGDYLLMVFYAPECPSCMETMQTMTEDRLLDEAVRNGRLTVLAVYTEGDEKEWKESCRKLPDIWIKGNDRMMIMDNALYDLKAMPSLYLLDKQKKVMLKDVPYTEVRRVLFF